MSCRVVKRAYKYRFYPTSGQADLLNRTFGSVRYVYNRALAERSRAWAREQRRVTFADTCRMLTGWKSDPETSWLYEVSNVALQQGLQHLQQAYAGFWGKRAKYPRFKSRHHSRASATFTTSGFRYKDGRVTLAKMSAPLDIRWSRALPEGAEPSSVTVSRDSAARWHISILTECPVAALPQVDAAVGIDAGITTLVTLSTGEKIASPRHDRRDRHRLVKAQRNLSRKKKGSANRAKARVKVARVHARIADRRRDHLHKLSARIIRESQAVIIEDLSVANMVRNHTLARAISDASWSEFRAMLEYKAAWYGRTVVAIDRFYPSSKTCSACGAIAAKMPLNVRDWTCAACGAAHDRDVNAAVNIRAARLAVLACGDRVRPPRT
jgi:putative transposase